MAKKSVAASDEAWDDRTLGADEASVKVADDDIEGAVDEAVGLQLISIRLQKSMIEDFKLIASLNGLGYQTLMRQILQRFADGEMKRLAREVAAERIAAQKSGKPKGASTSTPPAKQKKVA